MRVSLVQVTHQYPGFVLGPIDQEFSGTGLIVLTGSSGSGKSTLLRLLAGLHPPDSGSIRHNMEDLAKVSDSARSLLRRDQIAYSSQFPKFLDALDLKENLTYAARIRNSKTESPESILEKCGLTPQLTALPKKLSGGESSRANVARALIGRRSLICLDEPTSMLDKKCALQIRSLILSSSEHSLVIAATHDEKLKHAAKLCMILDNGKVMN